MNTKKETTAKTEREESEEIKMTTKERTLAEEEEEYAVVMRGFYNNAAEEEKERWYYSDFGMNLRKVTLTYNEGDKRKNKVYVFFAEDKDGNRYAYTWRLNDDMGLYYPAVTYAEAWARENSIDAVKIAAYKADGYADARKTTNEYLSGEISLKESESNKGLYTVDFSGEGEESAETEESTEEAEETAITATTTEEAPEEEEEKGLYSEFVMHEDSHSIYGNEVEGEGIKLYVFMAEDRNGRRSAATIRTVKGVIPYYSPEVYAKAWADDREIDAVKVAAYVTDTYETARKMQRDYIFGNIDLKPIDKGNGVYEIDIGDDKPKENPGTRFPKNSREDDKEQDKIAGNPVPENDGLTKEEMKLVREYNGVHRRLESLIRQASRGAFEGEMMDVVNDQRNAMREYMAALRERARLMGFDIITKKRE